MTSPRAVTRPRQGAQELPHEPGRTAAIITWFHPSADVVDGVRAALRDCDVVVVVDNTPGGQAAHDVSIPAGVVYVAQGGNTGLAAALNTGLARLAPDVLHVLLLDQDSVMPEHGLPRLLGHLAAADVAIAAPSAWDVRSGRGIDPLVALADTVRERDVVITSGAVVRRAALESVGTFRDDFFLDAVDQDMCLRLRNAGWRILQDQSVRLGHALGETRWHRVGRFSLRSTSHPTWRLYTAARNGAVLLREHARRRPRWCLRSAAQLGYWLVTVLLFEPPRRQRAAALVRGFHDGLAGRGSGAPSAWGR